MSSGLLERVKLWAQAIKRDVHALYLAARDPRVPWPAKLVAGCVAAYALSPIDLVPDFMPVLGYLDDLLIVPAGILLAVRMLPPAILAEHRATAAQATRPVGRAGLFIVAGVWAVFALTAGWLVYRHYSR